MSILRIRMVPDDVLRQRSKPVRKIGRSVRQLSEDMAETMYEANGIGLAAPQVGILRRLIVVDVGDGLHILVNPEVMRSRGEEVAVEGCLSMPGTVGDVPRAASVEVRALGLDGHDIWFSAEGLFARCLQHEIDHLNGVLFTDRAIAVRDGESEEEAVGDGEQEVAADGRVDPS